MHNNRHFLSCFLIQLFLLGKLLATQPDWSVNVPDFEFNMSLIGVVLFDDIESNDPNDIIAAFVGDEIRGVANPTYFPITERYTFGMPIYSNVTSGEIIAFKAYDASEDVIYDIYESLEFVPDAIIGNDLTPEVFHAYDFPIATDDTITTAEDTSITENVLANDMSLVGDTLTVVSVTQASNGSVVINVDNTVTYTPVDNFHGIDEFDYVILDGKGGLDTATVIVNVTPVNDPPVITSPAVAAATEDAYFVYHATATDPEDSTVTFTFDQQPTWLLTEADSAYGTPLEGVVDTSFRVIAFDGELRDTLIVTVNFIPVDIRDHLGIPTEFALHQNYPNPFNPTTTIRFNLPIAINIHIVVYDLLGGEVVQLVEQRLELGYHQVEWNGKNETGREIPSGIYIARLVTPEYTQSIKMVLLK